MAREVVAGRRSEVEEASKPAREGVRSALRFCVIVSSRKAREVARKAVWWGVSWVGCGEGRGGGRRRGGRGQGGGKEGEKGRKNVHRRAVSLKQNWGVRCGGGEGGGMAVVGVGGGGGAAGGEGMGMGGGGGGGLVQK